MKQSKEIIQFYREIDAWIKGGCRGDRFEKFCGLCYNLSVYCGEKLWELERQFVEAGLDIDFPFGKEEYEYQQDNDELYKCPKRLAWIEDRLRDAAKQEKEKRRRKWK